MGDVDRCGPQLGGPAVTIVFLDTETTGLAPDRRVWEIAVIVRSHSRDHEQTWFIDAADLDLGNADLNSLNVGRFYERHPQANGSTELWPIDREIDALRQVEALTRGATIVASVPSFDADVLSRRMRAHGICPAWHYRLQDVKTLAAGYLIGRGESITFPYDPEDLSRRLGVEPPANRHEALADARWDRDLFDAVTSGKATG